MPKLNKNQKLLKEAVEARGLVFVSATWTPLSRDYISRVSGGWEVLAEDENWTHEFGGNNIKECLETIQNDPLKEPDFR